jgi:16S rRNA G966 N2-methylase RsmD
MSYPTARRISEELHFLDIVDIASVTDYANSEVKISLKQEYQWFKNDEFRKLVKEVSQEQEQEEKDRREESRTISKFLSKEPLDKEAETSSDTYNSTDQTAHDNIQNTSVDNTLLACDTVTCHTLKKNLPHTQRNNIFTGTINKEEDDSQKNRSSTDMTDPNHHYEAAENKRDYIEGVSYTKNSNSSVTERGHSPAAELDDSIINNNNNNNVQSLNRCDSYHSLDVEDTVNNSNNNSVNNFPVPVGSIDLIFTDPPYPKEYLPLYHDLAAAASRILKSGGSLVTYSNHCLIPEITKNMEDSGLNRQWILAVKLSGPFAHFHPKKVSVKWKPLLWFVKGNRTNSLDYISDFIESRSAEKASFEWEQNTIEAEHVISRLTVEGQTVCDPMMGEGTSGIAATKLGRRFIGIEIDSERFDVAKARISKASVIEVIPDNYDDTATIKGGS